MASSNSFIHIDVLRVAAFVWPAGDAVDRGLELVEEEFKEMEGGKPVTLLVMWLSVKNEDELVVLVIFGEKRKFSLFHRSLDFTGRSAAPLMGLRQVALQDTRFYNHCINTCKSYKTLTRLFLIHLHWYNKSLLKNHSIELLDITATPPPQK